MKNLLSAWKWSLGVVARSPLTLAALGTLSALWGFGAYRWLLLPESSVLMLLLALVWAVAQLTVAISVVGGSAAGASAVAGSEARALPALGFISFSRPTLVRTSLLAVISLVPIFAIAGVFAREDDYALAIASFLTLRSETAVSPYVVKMALWVVETIVWVMVAAFLLSFLLMLLRDGWRKAWRESGRTLKRSCLRGPFVTTLVSVVVFGGVSYLLAAWHPNVTPGFWDYTQAVLRLGSALILIVTGWLFLLLALARLSMATAAKPPPSVPPS